MHRKPWLLILVGAVALGFSESSAAQPQAREGFADVPGARLWYTDTGGPGIPVILLHANTGNIRLWEYQIPAFAAAGYRVIAYDRRGWGRTEVNPSGPQPGTAADDLQALADSLRIERFHLVATAGGGFVAVDYALSFPQRLRSLVIANSIGGIQDDEYLALGRRLRPPEFTALPPDVREIGPEYRAANAEGTRRWLELEKLSRPNPPAVPQTFKNRVTLSLIETLKPPALFISGGADMFAPPAVMKMYAAKVKNSQFVVMPDVGHSGFWEQPETFNRAVLNFIRKH